MGAEWKPKVYNAVPIHSEIEAMIAVHVFHTLKLMVTREIPALLGESSCDTLQCVFERMHELQAAQSFTM